MKNFLIFLLLAVCLQAAEYSLPAANQGYWTAGTAEGTPGVGIPGGLDRLIAGGADDYATSGTVVDITEAPYSADNTGMTHAGTALFNAISDASPNTIIYFPAGDYLFDGGSIPITNKSNIVIRGAGPGVTNFLCQDDDGNMMHFAGPGSFDTDTQTITGTKTKGTSTVTITDASSYSVGYLAQIRWENETDNTRIIAGAAPVWNSVGFPGMRKQVVMVTGKTSNTLTFDPPLGADGTNLALTVSRLPLDWKNSYIGFESFSVVFQTPHAARFINLDSSEYTWFYNVHFEGWTKDDDNGSCIKMPFCYRAEIRKCKFESEWPIGGTSNDGAIETTESTSALIHDNIQNQFQLLVYESGGSCNMVLTNNFCRKGDSPIGGLSYYHNAHPFLWLSEGNVAEYHQSDGYHGSSSHNNFYRNRLYGSNPVVLNRMKRNYAIVGNVLGRDGVTTPNISYGNPNIGNGNAIGFAGPTGLSDQEGQPDYLQPGYGENEYIIQAGDISSGDFWGDWEVTATLTTRSSDTGGVITVSGGTFDGGTLVAVWWSSKASNMLNGSVTNVAGSAITVSWSSGTLPAESTALQVYFGPNGWQERDLDVQASTTLVENYTSSSGGTGAITNGTSDTLPDSLVYTSKPAWFYDMTWPAIDPNSPPTSDLAGSNPTIPAEYRYFNGDANPSGGGTPTYSVGRLRFLRR